MDYYTSLLNEGSLSDSGLVDENPSQSVMPVESTENNVFRKTGRTKNFTVEEDILLVSAWLNISTDAVQGINQKNERYWQMVHGYFHQFKNCESQRTASSLMKRWSLIQLSVNKFCGYYAQISARQQSGISESDKVCQAVELYTSIQKHPFQFLHCWRELKDAPKWRIDSSKKKSKTPYKSGHASSSPASSIPSSPDTINLGEDDIARDTFSEGLERPIGRKATKELLRKGKGKREFDTSMPMA
ncbi:glutathione S-transferase T2-like [Asparagus officinalis]|uniref:glutathione S-transferase T2-like n=1 Tax=Asparagus officinalis TaxID=4686 RepID=UPI00098DE8E9|nr:glutathione S-transferase T2-like [Asparagus officinalis]